jgi:energy-coupling factor transporter ATP-binding protein EcfA2
MRLLRVQVPEFRALKDVDISFEPDFTPQVFPLGSLNGGGKSTLLQLIFVLLHCIWGNNPREKYLKHIAELISNYDSVQFSKLASITVSTSHGKVCLEYFYGNNRDSVLNKLNLKFDNSLSYPLYDIEEKKHFIYFLDIPYFFILINVLEQPKIIEKSIEEIQKMNNVFREIINEIEEKIFLISQSNQPHIFLSREENRLLFTSNPEKTYDQVLKGLKDSLPNFYTYDFIDVLTEVCRLERDKDFDEKLATGIYGTHYEKLENTINSFFIDGKKVNPLTVQQKRHTKDAIQSMGFKLSSGQEIYPEDLSHGELKRLAIFVLLKYRDIQDSIILMDEIENGFHPDWQYTIVRDLVEWGKNNQYILATHSYELCTAVTPAHVKELEPRLIK